MKLCKCGKSMSPKSSATLLLFLPSFVVTVAPKLEENLIIYQGRRISSANLLYNKPRRQSGRRSARLLELTHLEPVYSPRVGIRTRCLWGKSVQLIGQGRKAAAHLGYCYMLKIAAHLEPIG